jgi:hypothetical protein
MVGNQHQRFFFQLWLETTLARDEKNPLAEGRIGIGLALPIGVARDFHCLHSGTNSGAPSTAFFDPLYFTVNFDPLPPHEYQKGKKVASR